MADRSLRIDAFLAAAGWAGARRGVLAADASFRRYDRVELDGRVAQIRMADPSSHQ